MTSRLRNYHRKVVRIHLTSNGKDDVNSTNHFANNKQADCFQNKFIVNEIHYNEKFNTK